MHGGPSTAQSVSGKTRNPNEPKYPPFFVVVLFPFSATLAFSLPVILPLPLLRLCPPARSHPQPREQPCLRSALWRCHFSLEMPFLSQAFSLWCTAKKKYPRRSRVMPVRCSPSLHLPGLLSALATSPLHLCVVNKNNPKVLGSRQSNPRDSKHLRGFVSKATSCLLAAKGHGNEGSLWKMNSSVTTTTKKSAGERIGEGGLFLGGPGKSEAERSGLSCAEGQGAIYLMRSRVLPPLKCIAPLPPT